MKIAVISYSLTGNNEALASSVAEKFTAKHIKIKEHKSRTMGTIILDMILKRTPKIQPKPDSLENYDLILFFGPVWMGQVATPLRTYLNHIKTNTCRYAFITISGGADGENKKLKRDLKKRTGKEPVALIDLHKSDFLSSDIKITRKVTMDYRINNEEIKKLTNTIVNSMKEKILV